MAGKGKPPSERSYGRLTRSGRNDIERGLDRGDSCRSIARSISRPGNPHDNAVVESTSHILKRELVADRRFGSEEELRTALFDWANWYNNFRIHSTLGYMSPVEFREAGLILS